MAWALFFASCLALPKGIEAQRLYDAKRDEEAQAALKIADTLKSGTLFDKQLKNLSLLAKRDMEASLADARARMRTEINSFTTWTDVNCTVATVDRSISQIDEDNDDITAKLVSLRTDIAQAKAAFAELQRATECKLAAGSDNIDLEKCPELKPGQFEAFFEHAGDLKDIEEAVSLLDNSHGKSKNVNEALAVATGLVASLKTLYENYKKRMEEYNNLQGELLNIQLQLKKVALQALQVEEQHLKSIIKIRTRREAEEAAIIEMIDDYEKYSVALDLGFDRKARPCPESDFSSAGSIEMELRQLVARLKLAESNLDGARQNLAQRELSLVRQYSNLRTAREALADARADSAKQDAQERIRGLKEQIRAREKELGIPEARSNVDELTLHVSTLRNELNDRLFVLYLAAAISARGEIPRKLATIREANENHAYSIRRSGVMARAYQLTVSGGVRRLALYHKGGIKPSKIAELIHAAATVAIPLVIASN
ncbi:MAG TPA: hypothetical protein VM656_17170 [Pyrinomonadaceae bacterium]|nr:hypothetical protein [Pyrinomonadaceae bacterium]